MIEWKKRYHKIEEKLKPICSLLKNNRFKAAVENLSAFTYVLYIVLHYILYCHYKVTVSGQTIVVEARQSHIKMINK